MASLTSYGVGENLKRQLSANAEFPASNVPYKYKRRKVLVVRTFPDVFKQVTTHVNPATNESLVVVGTVNNLSCKIDSVGDQEDDSFEPFKHDGLESREKLVSTQMHVLSNDLESEKVGPEAASDLEENFRSVELPEALDDGEIGQSETQCENIDPKTTIPRRKFSVIRDFPKAFGQFSGKINSIANEAMTPVETVQNLLDKEEITDKLEGGFESSEIDLKSRENFIHDEMHDLSNDLGSERPKASDNEQSRDQLDTSGDKSAICLPKRRVSAIRFFPPGCGRNAVCISKEGRVKLIPKEPLDKAERDIKQVTVEAQGEDIKACLDSTEDMMQNKVEVCLDASKSEKQNVVGSDNRGLSCRL